MGQNSVQFIQILFVVIVLALSGLTWVTRKLQEQRARKRRLVEQQRRMEEMLRTGRDPLAEQAAALQRATATDRARLEELARRRQAQMEQLRREQMQRRQEAEQAARGDGRGEAGVPPIIIMGPSGPIAIPRGPGTGAPRPPAAPTGGIRPSPGRPAPPRGGIPTRPAPAQAPPPARPAQQRQARPEKPRQKRERPARVESSGERPAAAPAPAREPAASGAARGRRARGPVGFPLARGMTREEYRRLIASVELFRPPLALRPPEAGGGPSPLV